MTPQTGLNCNQSAMQRTALVTYLRALEATKAAREAYEAAFHAEQRALAALKEAAK